MEQKEGSQLEIFKQRIRMALFNRFYLDFIAYIIILILGLFLSVTAYWIANDDTVKIFLGIVITVLVFLMLYILGFLSARKKKGSNKYMTCFKLYILLFVIYIFATLFYNENANNFFLINIVGRFKNLILLVHSNIFKWVNILLNKEIPNEIYVLVTPFIVFLGSRKNRKIETKKIIKKKEFERRENNG